MKKLIPLILLFSFSLIVTAQAQESLEAKRLELLGIAMTYLGTPYRYGAESPSAFDCSGFVRYVYRKLDGRELPRSSRDYMKTGVEIAVKDALPGDIFVFNTVGNLPSHIAIFTGQGFIHAVSDGPKTGVIISPMNDSYWSKRILAVRQVLPRVDMAVIPGGSGKAGSAPAPASPAPSVSQPPSAAGKALVDIEVAIPKAKSLTEDPVKTQSGTEIAFTLQNGSGTKQKFTVIFIMLEKKTLKLHEIYEERLTLTVNESFTLPAYSFDIAGKYRLIVKDAKGNHLLERTFEVAD